VKCTERPSGCACKTRLLSRSWNLAGCRGLTCGFAAVRPEFCALAGGAWAVGLAGVPVCADGEDVVGRDGCSDRVLVSPRFAGDRASGIGARRRANGAAEGRGAAAAGGRAGASGTWACSPPLAGAGRCRSRPCRWGTCWVLWRGVTGRWGLAIPLAATGCSGTWCWRGSSSWPASSMPRVCWRRPAWHRPPIPRSTGVCGSMPRTPGGRSWPPPARHMPGWARPAWCSMTSAPCIARLTQTMGSGRAGSPRSAAWTPQITIGLLTGQAGFPRMVEALGQQGRDKTMLPVIKSFMAAHQLPDVTVVADAGRVSEASQKEIEAAGLSFILEKSFRMSQKRPAGPAGLPPQTRLDRSPSGHCVRRPDRQPPDRTPDRLVNPQVRQGRPPLPDHADPGRTAHHRRRRSHPSELQESLTKISNAS
jgi:hypothetical protein